MRHLRSIVLFADPPEAGKAATMEGIVIELFKMLRMNGAIGTMRRGCLRGSQETGHHQEYHDKTARLQQAER